MAFRLGKFYLNKFDWLLKRREGEIIWHVTEVCFMDFVNTKILRKIPKNDGLAVCKPGF